MPSASSRYRGLEIVSPVESVAKCVSPTSIPTAPEPLESEGSGGTSSQERKRNQPEARCFTVAVLTTPRIGRWKKQRTFAAILAKETRPCAASSRMPHLPTCG